MPPLAPVSGRRTCPLASLPRQSSVPLMRRYSVRARWLSLPLAVALASDLGAQNAAPHPDPVQSVAIEVTPTRSSSRLRSLIRRIARRTADSTSVAHGVARLADADVTDSTDDAAVDSATMAIPPDIAQLFTSRADSVGW